MIFCARKDKVLAAVAAVALLGCLSACTGENSGSDGGPTDAAATAKADAGGQLEPSVDGGPEGPVTHVYTFPEYPPADQKACPARILDEAAYPELVSLEQSECKSHGDCNEKRNGSCQLIYVDMGGYYHYACIYDECFVDSDCPTPKACFCGVGFRYSNVCQGECRGNTDCPDGSRCLLVEGKFCGDKSAITHCAKHEDKCHSSEDGNCPAGDTCWPGGENGDQALECFEKPSDCGDGEGE